MKELQILVIDLNPATSFGSDLEDLVGSNTHVLTVQCRRINRVYRSIVDEFSPDVVILVLSEPRSDTVSTLIQRLGLAAATPICALIAPDDPQNAIELLNSGASDVIFPPLRAAEVIPRIWRLVRHRERSREPVEKLTLQLGLRDLVGTTESFLAEVRKLPLAAGADATVLITGETGTGKELFARAIHYLSTRSDKPFTPVNCGAVPTDLMENELFGHEGGAYTGASRSSMGLVSETEGGTLFLDEIDSLPLPAQVKLLRLLQEKEYRPLGSSRTRRADLRIIAATSADLAELVNVGKVRKDLYFRLNVVTMTLPPLRERRGDIRALANHFLSKYASEFKKPVRAMSFDVVECLLRYSWPGNVRELENTIERAVVLCEGHEILLEQIVLLDRKDDTRLEPFREAKLRVVSDFEKSYVESLLAAHDGNICRAARSAGKNRRAFFELMRKYRIDAQGFRQEREPHRIKSNSRSDKFVPHPTI